MFTMRRSREARKVFKRAETEKALAPRRDRAEGKGKKGNSPSRNSICLAIAGQQGHTLPRGFPQTRKPVMDGKIINSKGDLVGVVIGSEIFDLVGQKLYDLKGANIYRLSGGLIGHLNGSYGSDKRLDRSTDRLFSPSRP
jgi:hypothetical protein